MTTKWYRVKVAIAALLVAASSASAKTDDDVVDPLSLFHEAERAGLAGKIMTVSGAVEPAALGPTLMHEHLFWDEFDGLSADRVGGPISPAIVRRMQERGWSIAETDADRRLFNRGEITLDVIDDMRRGKRVRANHFMLDEAAVADELARFQEVGGAAVVDLTPTGLGQDPARLRRFSHRTGMKIVMGAGWYRWPFHPADLKDKSTEALTAMLVRQVVRGEDGGIRSGIIGEIPLDSRSIRIARPAANPMTNDEVGKASGRVQRRLSRMTAAERDAVPPAEMYDSEELRVLRAAGRASRLSGTALSLHITDASLSFLSILREEGVDLRRVIVGHAHPIFADREHLERALRAGLVLEADYQLQHYATRAPIVDIEPILDGVAYAIRTGRRDQVLLSLDLCNRLGYRRYGGGGYATLHNYIFPRLRARGVSQEDIDHIMMENPRRLLTLVKPQTPLR